MLKAPGLNRIARGHFSAKMMLTNSTGVNRVPQVLSNCFLHKNLSQVQRLCLRVLLSKMRPWVANTWKMDFSQTKALTSIFLSLNNYIWVRSANKLPWLPLLLPSPEMQHFVMYLRGSPSCTEQQLACLADCTLEWTYPGSQWGSPVRLTHDQNFFDFFLPKQ